MAVGGRLARRASLFVGLYASALGAAEHDAAHRAYDAGQFEVAKRLWMPAAEAGDGSAQLGLATLYDLGQGLPRDSALAYRWYRRAAEAGVPDAEFNVAVLEDSGDGVAHRPEQAALWYGRAAAHGNHRAQYNLAQLYALGEGVPYNPDQAASWLRAAASLPAAAAKLANLRRTAPQRPPPDTEQAPLAVQLSAPVDGSAIPLLHAPGDLGSVVELVWAAPSQPPGVRFFIQVIALPSDPLSTQSSEAFADYSDATAALATVGRGPGRYAWRVYSVSRTLRRYAASDWARFEVLEPTPPARPR